MSNREINSRLKQFITEEINPRNDRQLNSKVRELLEDILRDTQPTEEFLAKPQELLVA